MGRQVGAHPGAHKLVALIAAMGNNAAGKRERAAQWVEARAASSIRMSRRGLPQTRSRSAPSQGREPGRAAVAGFGGLGSSVLDPFQIDLLENVAQMFLPRKISEAECSIYPMTNGGALFRRGCAPEECRQFEALRRPNASSIRGMILMTGASRSGAPGFTMAEVRLDGGTGRRGRLVRKRSGRARRLMVSLVGAVPIWVAVRPEVGNPRTPESQRASSKLLADAPLDETARPAVESGKPPANTRKVFQNGYTYVIGFASQNTARFRNSQLLHPRSFPRDAGAGRGRGSSFDGRRRPLHCRAL